MSAAAADEAAIGTLLQSLRLDASAAQRRQLVDYLGLLQRWNRAYNLTAVRDPAEMLTQHLADCLAVIPPLDARIGTLRSAVPASVLDVGSGAGLPGVVIAALRPQLAVTCIDAVGKKMAFVRQVGGELGLRNLQAVHGRVEAQQGSHGVVCSRAFASLSDFTSWTRHLVAEGGCWMAMKGRPTPEELAALPKDLTFHVEPLVVPGLDADRCLVWLKKAAAVAG